MSGLDQAQRRELALRYANGEFTVHELRDAGHVSMIEVLADLSAIGRRPPLAEMIGPNIDTRHAGIDRLAAVLRR